MGKLPQISGRKAVRCFEKLGYVVVRQKGSHMRLICQTDSHKKPLTIPDHTIIGKGLLRKLMRDADITVDTFLQLL